METPIANQAKVGRRCKGDAVAMKRRPCQRIMSKTRGLKNVGRRIHRSCLSTQMVRRSSMQDGRPEYNRGRTRFRQSHASFCPRASTGNPLCCILCKDNNLFRGHSQACRVLRKREYNGFDRCRCECRLRHQGISRK